MKFRLFMIAILLYALIWSDPIFSQTSEYLAYADAEPVIAAFGKDAPSELLVKSSDPVSIWNEWARKADASIRSRLEQGDEDSIVNLLLFGTSFTKEPRMTEAQIRSILTANLDKAKALESALSGRLTDFSNAVGAKTINERLNFARAHLTRKLQMNISTASGKVRVKRFLIDSLIRVLKESDGFAGLIEQARKNREDEFMTRSQLFSNRGLSSDTSLKPNFAIKKALTEMKAKGLLSVVKRVAIIGPGLDFTDKDEGYDFYPPQTIQPFAVIESLLKLNLATENVAIDTFDLSPKVNSHIRDMAQRATQKRTYSILLPLNRAEPFSEEFIGYWRAFGTRIGSEKASRLKSNIADLDVRTVDVRPTFLKQIRAYDANIVMQHPGLRANDRYDLIIGTNIFLYYDTFEQALAMRNLDKMLKPGAILLSNNGLIEFPFTPIRSIGYTSATYSRKKGDADAIVWYQKEK